MNDNVLEAIRSLKLAKDVTDWNIIRETFVSILSTQELAIIDSSGLIVEVLGKDTDTFQKRDATF